MTIQCLVFACGGSDVNRRDDIALTDFEILDLRPTYPTPFDGLGAQLLVSTRRGKGPDVEVRAADWGVELSGGVAGRVNAAFEAPALEPGQSIVAEGAALQSRSAATARGRPARNCSGSGSQPRSRRRRRRCADREEPEPQSHTTIAPTPWSIRGRLVGGDLAFAPTPPSGPDSSAWADQPPVAPGSAQVLQEVLDEPCRVRLRIVKSVKSATFHT